MQVIISVGGRFQDFNLAQKLLKRGYLKKLIRVCRKILKRNKHCG